MATIVDGKGNEYLFTFSPPETEWIRDLAECMGITKEAIVAAAMNKGLIYYTETFVKSKIVDVIKGLAENEIDVEPGDKH